MSQKNNCLKIISVFMSSIFLLLSPRLNSFSINFGKFTSMGRMNRTRDVHTLKESITEVRKETFERQPKSKNFDKPRVIFVLGGPGAGKGTQCEKLSKDLGMTHLSAGELLRAERLSGSENGQLIENFIKEGKIVPVKITLDCLQRAMEKTNSHRFLIDGFPRNADNVEGWTQHMPGVCDLESVIFIDCPEQELERRLLERGRTSGRSDDNLESARKRFTTFHKETLPVVIEYEKQGYLIRISGAQTIDRVYSDLRKAVEPYIVNDLIERTQQLLDAISARDWPAYEELVDPAVTAFENEAMGHLVSGLDFHKFYFHPDNLVNKQQSTMSQPHVRIMGTSAVVAYVRLIQIQREDGSHQSIVFDETRIWQLIDGNWRNVHFHRSPSVLK